MLYGVFWVFLGVGHMFVGLTTVSLLCYMKIVDLPFAVVGSYWFLVFFCLVGYVC